MSHAPTELAPDDWMVAVAPGNIQTMTIDQLDAAYQAGHITEQTMVWTHGMDAWLPLAEVVGGDDDEAAEPPAPSTASDAPAASPDSAQPQRYRSEQPTAAYGDFQHPLPTAAVAPAAAHSGPAQQPSPYGAVQQPAGGAYAASGQPAAAPQGQFAQGQFAQGQFAQGPVAQALPGGLAAQGQPPVTAAQFGQPLQPSAPEPSVPPAPAPSLSTAPVAFNPAELALDDVQFGKKKSKAGLWAAAVVVLAGGAFTVVNLSGQSAGAGESSAAAAAQPIAEGDKPLQVNDPNAPLQTSGGYQVTDAEQKAFAKEAEKEAKLREQMAAALAGKDEQSASKASSARKAPRPAVRRGSAKQPASSSGVKSGGSAYDPLNSDLP